MIIIEVELRRIENVKEHHERTRIERMQASEVNVQYEEEEDKWFTT